MWLLCGNHCCFIPVTSSLHSSSFSCGIPPIAILVFLGTLSTHTLDLGNLKGQCLLLFLLGYVISDQGLQMDPDKLLALLNWPGLKGFKLSNIFSWICHLQLLLNSQCFHPGSPYYYCDQATPKIGQKWPSNS